MENDEQIFDFLAAAEDTGKQLDDLIKDIPSEVRKTFATEYRKSPWLATSKSASSLTEAIVERFPQNPELPIRTVTPDNGMEFAEHAKLLAAWSAQVFSVHPYSSWERGVNENTNGLLRQYFPKGMELREVGKERIAEVENLLNNRPRKRLAYRAPAEEMTRLTHRSRSVRFGI